jgi:hypothetical protein
MSPSQVARAEPVDAASNPPETLSPQLLNIHPTNAILTAINDKKTGIFLSRHRSGTGRKPGFSQDIYSCNSWLSPKTVAQIIIPSKPDFSMPKSIIL